MQWKTNTNPVSSKQAQGVVSNIKINQIKYPPLFFIYNLVHSTSTQKHLGMVLDAKLNFKVHPQNIYNKVIKITFDYYL